MQFINSKELRGVVIMSNYYLHLIEQGQIKAAEAWLDMYNRLVYFQLKPRDGEIEAAKLLKGLKYG
jgi:hypothetical protein